MKFSRRKLMQGSAAIGLLSFGGWKHGSSPASWKAMTLGGGGFADAISQSKDAVTTVTRNDSGHAYIRSAAQNQWLEITTVASIPSPYNTTGSMTTECVVAPNNNQIIYLLFNGLVFKSTNAGVSFSGPLLGFNNGNALDPSSVSSNDAYRLSNYKMAVDPINANVLFVGTGVDGLWMTPDGGTTWNLVPVPVSVPGLLTGATITATGGATNVITTASGGTAAPIGYFAYDQTNPNAIPPNTTVIGKTATTVTLSGSTTAASVANGDIILFFNFNVLRATAAGSGSTITCGNGTGTAVSNGMYVFDFTNPSALAVGTKVSTFTGTTLNLSSSAASVASGDLLLVGNPSTFVGNNPNYCIAFDPASTVTGGKTQGVYVYGNGSPIQHSLNGGTSFTPASSGPTTPPKCLRVNPAGLVWVVSGQADFAGGNTNLWSGSGTTFTQFSQATISSASFVGTLAVSPHINGGGHYPVTLFASTNPLNMSVDDGANWLGTWNGAVTPLYSPNPTPAQAVAWLTIPTTPSAGCAMYDNVSTTLMWMADGVGTHYADPFPQSRIQFTWFENTFGIENLVVTDMLSPLGSSVMSTAVQDRQIFYVTNPGTAPADYKPGHAGINPCQGIDYAANNPSYMAAVINGNNSNSCYSIDGGNNWTIFATMPGSLGNTGTGGAIACGSYTSTTNANVVMGVGTAALYYTTDNGSGTSGGWQACSGLPAPGGILNGTGLRVLAADRVNAGTFYLYYHTGPNFYRSVDGGATWTNLYNGNPSGASGLTSRLRALPGVAGTILFVNSTVVGTGTLQICTNGVTATNNSTNALVWNNINVNLTNVVDFGFGAASLTYPTIFVIGTYNNQQGCWKSADLGVTWTAVGPVPFVNPLGHIAQWSCVGSDLNHSNRMFVGTANDGAYFFS